MPIGTDRRSSRIVIGIGFALVNFFYIHSQPSPLNFLIALHQQLILHWSLSPLYRHRPSSVVRHPIRRHRSVGRIVIGPLIGGGLGTAIETVVVGGGIVQSIVGAVGVSRAKGVLPYTVCWLSSFFLGLPD